MREVAMKARQYLADNHNDINLPFIYAFPKNCCELTSIILCKILYNLEPEKNIFLIEGYDRDENEHHYWVIADNLNLDITANQFNGVEAPLYGEENKYIIGKFNIIEKIQAAKVFANNDIYISNEAEITRLVDNIITTLR